MASQALWGVFATFQNGADVAWLTDEIGERAAHPMYLRSDQWWRAGSLVGIVACVASASLAGLRAPILASGGGFLVVGLFMAFAMREEGFRRNTQRASDGTRRSPRRCGELRQRSEHIA